MLKALITNDANRNKLEKCTASYLWAEKSFTTFLSHKLPNGPALSCDDENFQHALNEMSSRSIFLIPLELYSPWILHHAHFVSLSAWLGNR